jgi:phosphomevalonate decarboxylase
VPDFDREERPMKASAIAHPIQGLIKYHGLKDTALRLPFHGSISVCTGPTHSHTTIEVLDSGEDAAQGEIVARIDGETASGKALDRLRTVVQGVRDQVRDGRPCRVESKNSFPQFVGLGSSSSGFAALAVAAAEAYGWQADSESISEVARLGAGSACRAVTGGVSEWIVEPERSYSRCLLAPEDLDWRIVVPLVEHEEPTDDVHREVVTSPLFEARVGYVDGMLESMRQACVESDLEAIWAAAEADTLNLHAVTMTGRAGHLTWQPATVAVIHKVRELRTQGVPVWFSIDTGATAYLNTSGEFEDRVATAVEAVPGVARMLHLEPAGAARLVEDHLF